MNEHEALSGKDDAAISQLLENYIVGISNHELPINTSHEMQLIAAHMAAQAQQSIEIISRNLDRKIYDNKAFQEAIIQLIKKNPKAEIRILIHDPSDANKRNHLLVNLHQKLDSFITIKRIHKEYKEFNHAYLNIDHAAVIYREFSDLYEGTANYNDKLLAKNLHIEFTKIWELSEPEIQFRNLQL